MSAGSLIPKPFERPGNEASVCCAAVAVVTKATVIVVSRGVQEYKLTHGTAGGDMI